MKFKKIYKYLSCLCAFSLLAACGSGSGDSTGSNLSSPGSVRQGVVVDPYIVGAVFQEVAADGTTVLQRQSTPSDANGVFIFPTPITPGSTVEMKISQKGLHGGAPFQGILRRTVDGDDLGSVAVTPLTTLLANGIPPADVLQALTDCGFYGLTADDLTGDPMQGLQNKATGVSDQDLRLLQAAMSVEAYMEIIGNFQVTADDLYNYEQSQILSSVAGAMQNMLNAAEFNRISAALVNDPALTVQPDLGDFIMAVLDRQQTLIALAREDWAANGSLNQTLVDQTVQDGIAQMVAQVKLNCQARQPQPDPTTPPDGVALYNSACADCHVALANTSKPGRTADQIQAAIDNNVGGMGYMSSLTMAEVQAIADALATTSTPPPAPADGATLYGDNCAGCHGPLATSSKPGRTAADIQAAINGNIGGMGYLNSLTTSEVQAIADALPAASQPGPTTPPDGVALYNSECAGCHGVLANTTKPGRTAAQIQSAINNNSGGMGYLSSLTTFEMQAIADALPAAPAPNPTTPPDGATLYTGNCAGCHGALATTTKPGRTAAQIQTAINNNSGGMGYLSSLTTSEVQAIADVLPPATNPGPDYSNCTACHGQPPAGSSYPNTAGAHAVHVTLASVNNNCGTCHVGAGHNGQVDLGIAATFNAQSGTATANSNSTCANISCHGGKTTPVWETGSIAVDTQCTSCHASGTGQYNSYNSGQHSRHINKGYSCTVCHNTAKLQTGHFSNLATSGFEQSPAATVGGGSTSVGSYSGGTCSSVSCHGSKNW